jgi:hypothetical protein
MRAPGERVCREAPWVRIPPSPPQTKGLCNSSALSAWAPRVPRVCPKIRLSQQRGVSPRTDAASPVAARPMRLGYWEKSAVPMAAPTFCCREWRGSLLMLTGMPRRVRLAIFWGWSVLRGRVLKGSNAIRNPEQPSYRADEAFGQHICSRTASAWRSSRRRSGDVAWAAKESR